MTDTQGAGIMNKLFDGYAPWFGAIPQRKSGAIVSDRSGKITTFACLGMVDRGELFLDVGTEGNPIQELTHGVTVTDKWMEEMIDGDVEKRKIWAKVIQRRGEIGYPYIFFTDKANNGAPDVYQDKNLRINASNLCTEITLHTKSSKYESGENFLHF